MVHNLENAHQIQSNQTPDLLHFSPSLFQSEKFNRKSISSLLKRWQFRLANQSHTVSKWLRYGDRLGVPFKLKMADICKRKKTLEKPGKNFLTVKRRKQNLFSHLGVTFNYSTAPLKYKLVHVKSKSQETVAHMITHNKCQARNAI